MNKCKFLVVLVALFMPMWMTVASGASNAREHLDRFEFGLSAGVGFYVNQEDPLNNDQFSRIHVYDVLGFGEKTNWGWPGIETFGFMFGYRIDTRWHVKLQTTRQRICFAEYAQGSDLKNVYYNAMWHVDAMAEYNILPLSNVMMSKRGMYNVVPYVGFGLGLTMYNPVATLRAQEERNSMGEPYYEKRGSMYPRVGSIPVAYDVEKRKVTEWGPNPVDCAFYIPVAVGVKWRANDNIQLKATFQYNFYSRSNLEGASYNETYTPNSPTVEQLAEYVGISHDCLFSLTAIFNFGKWYEDRLIAY